MVQLSGRSIRTFVLRQGRLTEGQQRSIDQYWSVYGIDPRPDDIPNPDDVPDKIRDRNIHADDNSANRIDLNHHFETEAPVWMEIGIGNGDALVHMAQNNPSVNFLGVEVHLPGVGHALGEVGGRELKNVRLIRYDVLDLIEHFMLPESVDRVLIYFPDPWHKTRHHKRRLVNAGFLDMVARLLRADGIIHFASDWEPYARQVQAVVAEHPDFQCLHESDRTSAITELRPETHFERRGLRLGHKVTDLVIRKISD